MTAPETPNAPAHEPHPCPENTPDDVDPATKLRERQKPDEHCGEHLFDKNPPGDAPPTLLPPELTALHETFSR